MSEAEEPSEMLEESGTDYPEDEPSEVAEQLARVVRGLVDDSDSVVIEEEDVGGNVALRVSVSPDELGRVIGRQGRTVRALRTLLEVRGTESDLYYDLEVVES